MSPKDSQEQEKEREQGRAGYCRFQIGHVTAALEVGNYTKQYPISSNVQVVGVENDKCARHGLEE